MVGAGLLAGERVRRAATGEDGVVLSVGDGVLAQVAFPSGTVWIHPEELEKLPEGPAERLAAGELGHLEPSSTKHTGCAGRCRVQPRPGRHKRTVSLTS